MDNLDEAERFFKQSVLISKEINAKPELAAVYYNLGLLYKKRGKKDKAREYFKQAQEIYALMVDTPDYQELKKELLELSSTP
jgi:tetratricopeptide (TPR) repeat protein